MTPDRPVFTEGSVDQELERTGHYWMGRAIVRTFSTPLLIQSYAGSPVLKTHLLEDGRLVFELPEAVRESGRLVLPLQPLRVLLDQLAGGPA